MITVRDDVVVINGSNSNFLTDRKDVWLQFVKVVLPNENTFSCSEKVLSRRVNMFRGSLLVAPTLFTVTTPLHDFKRKSLAINSRDLDEVMLQKAHRRSALLAVGLAHCLCHCDESCD